jgi:LuxR family maltose regulon positive regulatory protein
MNMSVSAEIPISRTKITVPERRADLLSRTRLLALIYQLLDKKLALISAPAGYGKTSALIDFSHQSDLPICWLSLDTLDRDPQRFIGYFIAALSHRFPNFGGQVEVLLTEITSFKPKHMERLVVTLVNDLYEHAREHFVVILDDYHLVDYVEEIQHFINRFVQLVDENCHLIISSRSIIPLPDLPLMVARQQVDGLSNLELAFRANEIQALFEKNYHTSLSKTASQALEKESEGWITGLQLSNMAVRQGETILPRITRASGVGLFEYFAHQILEQQPKEMREFLLYSSLLGEFNVALCESVLSRFMPKNQVFSELITAVLQKNLFALSVGTDGKWIRYHHLFRDFLQIVLNEEAPKLVDAIFYRLSGIYVEQGEWEKAYHIYLQLEDFEKLGELVEKAGTPLLQNGRLLTLKSWLDNIPEGLRQSQPGLISLEGLVICMLGNVTKGLSLLNQAEIAFRTSRNTSGLARTLVRRTTAHQYQGNYSESLMDAEEALTLTNEQKNNSDINLDALRSKGLSLYHLGQGIQAAEWLKKSLEGYTQLNKTPNILIVLTELGMVYQAIGDFESAQTSYEKAFNTGREIGNLVWKANLLNNLGVLYHLLARYEKAIQTFEEGLEFAKQSGRIRVEVALLIGLGDLFADLEEIEAAGQSYQQAREIIQPVNDNFLDNYLVLSEAKIARSRNEYSQAHQLLLSAQVQIQESDSSYEQGLLHLEKGRLAVTEEDTSQALLNLEKAKRYFKQDGRKLEYTWSCFASSGNGIIGIENKTLS